MELKDQGFEVGDEVVFFESGLVVSEGVVSCVSGGKSVYPVAVAVGMKEFCFTKDGRWSLFNEPQRLFHCDAVTVDEHGRLTAINHDYVKERTPKIVTKEPHEFVPFEKVLGRDSKDDCWHCNMFSHYQDGANYPFMVFGASWAHCIPFAGNEHLVGKVTE